MIFFFFLMFNYPLSEAELPKLAFSFLFYPGLFLMLWNWLVEHFLFLDYTPLRMDNEKLFLQLYLHTLLWVPFFFTQYLLVLCYEQQVFSLWTFSIIYLPFVHYLTSNIPFEIIILSQYFILHSEICLSFFYLSVLNNIY